MDHPLIVENVCKVYRRGRISAGGNGGGTASGSVQALQEVSLEVGTGQFLAVMGASGSGKSTLLHLMAGLARPDRGRVLINGIDMATMGDRKLTAFRRRNIGLVFQSFNLIPTLSARENIALPLMLEGESKPAIRRRVDELLDVLGIAARGDHRPDAMSGGEQQRVAIGRALVGQAVLILADEPTGNLDSTNSRGVCELLHDLSTVHGKTIVMVTHEPAVAAYAGEVAVLRDGRLVDRFATPNGPTDGGHELAIRYQESLR